MYKLTDTFCLQNDFCCFRSSAYTTLNKMVTVLINTRHIISLALSLKFRKKWPLKSPEIAVFDNPTLTVLRQRVRVINYHRRRYSCTLADAIHAYLYEGQSNLSVIFPSSSPIVLHHTAQCAFLPRRHCRQLVVVHNAWRSFVSAALVHHPPLQSASGTHGLSVTSLSSSTTLSVVARRDAANWRSSGTLFDVLDVTL